MPRYKITGRVTYDFTVITTGVNEDDAIERCDPTDGELQIPDDEQIEVEEIRVVES